MGKWNDLSGMGRWVNLSGTSRWVDYNEREECHGMSRGDLGGRWWVYLPGKEKMRYLHIRKVDGYACWKGADLMWIAYE